MEEELPSSSNTEKMERGSFSMSSPKDRDFEEFFDEAQPSARRQVPVSAVLKDIKAGLRTKGFLIKYGISLTEFEELIKRLVREGLLSKEEFKTWKSHRAEVPMISSNGSAPLEAVQEKPSGGKTVSPQDDPQEGELTRVGHTVTTYIINDPEKNESWALQLFAIRRDNIKGAKFKINLHGRRYAFVVEDMLYRGQIHMKQPVKPKKPRGPKTEVKDKRQEALEFIAKHGWAAYLEQRAYRANFGGDDLEEEGLTKARLVVLHCKNETYLAALHTPLPTVNLYVSSSLQNILNRLGKTVDTTELKMGT